MILSISQFVEHTRSSLMLARQQIEGSAAKISLTNGKEMDRENTYDSLLVLFAKVHVSCPSMWIAIICVKGNGGEMSLQYDGSYGTEGVVGKRLQFTRCSTRE